MSSVFAGGSLVLEKDLEDKMLWPVVSNLLTAQQTRKPAILSAWIGYNQLYTLFFLNIALLSALSVLLLSLCLRVLSVITFPPADTLFVLRRNH